MVSDCTLNQIIRLFIVAHRPYQFIEIIFQKSRNHIVNRSKFFVTYKVSEKGWYHFSAMSAKIYSILIYIYSLSNVTYLFSLLPELNTCLIFHSPWLHWPLLIDHFSLLSLVHFINPLTNTSVQQTFIMYTAF